MGGTGQDCFHILTLINSAIMLCADNGWIEFSLPVHLGDIELLGHVAILHLVFEELTKYFSTVTAPFMIPSV